MKNLFCKIRAKSNIVVVVFMSFLLAGLLVLDGRMADVNAADAKKTDKKVSTKKDSKAGKKADAKGKDAKAAAKEEEKKDEFKFDPNDPKNPIYLGSFGEKRSTGNIGLSGYASEAARLGSGWHPEGIAIEQLPKDRFGLINWVELADKKMINPQGIFPGSKKKENKVFNMDILFKMKGGYVDNVIFPHGLHTYWLDCTNCHNEIFFQFAGWNEVKMQEIVKGEWCGRCHGKVAFPVSDCTRCHKYPTGHEVEKAKTTTHRRPKPQ